MGGCALGVGVAVGADVAVAVGADVAVGVAVGADVAVGVAVGAAVGVSAGVAVAVPRGGCALGPTLAVGDGVSGGLVGWQAAASSPAAKELRAWRKLRREMSLTRGEGPA
jgi:hypothetical protein